MKLYIIRHGDPDYTNDTLTPLGKRQAEAVARRFAQNLPDRIYSSPMGRARATALPTCELAHKEAEILDWASEQTLYDNLSVEKEDGNSRWCFAKQNTIYRNNDTIRLYDNWQKADREFERASVNEGIKKIADGSDKLLKSLGYERDGCVYKITKQNDENIAVFCHEGVGNTWISHLLQIPFHIVWGSFLMTHTGVTIFNFENNADGYTAPEMFCYSDVSHIFEARLPMTHRNIYKI